MGRGRAAILETPEVVAVPEPPPESMAVHAAATGPRGRQAERAAAQAVLREEFEGGKHRQPETARRPGAEIIGSSAAYAGRLGRTTASTANPLSGTIALAESPTLASAEAAVGSLERAMQAAAVAAMHRGRSARASFEAALQTTVPSLVQRVPSQTRRGSKPAALRALQLAGDRLLLHGTGAQPVYLYGPDKLCERVSYDASASLETRQLRAGTTVAVILGGGRAETQPPAFIVSNILGEALSLREPFWPHPGTAGAPAPPPHVVAKYLAPYVQAKLADKGYGNTTVLVSMIVAGKRPATALPPHLPTLLVATQPRQPGGRHAAEEAEQQRLPAGRQPSVAAPESPPASRKPRQREKAAPVLGGTAVLGLAALAIAPAALVPATPARAALPAPQPHVLRLEAMPVGITTPPLAQAPNSHFPYSYVASDHDPRNLLRPTTITSIVQAAIGYSAAKDGLPAAETTALQHNAVIINPGIQTFMHDKRSPNNAATANYPQNWVLNGARYSTRNVATYAEQVVKVRAKQLGIPQPQTAKPATPAPPTTAPATVPPVADGNHNNAGIFSFNNDRQTRNLMGIVAGIALLGVLIATNRALRYNRLHPRPKAITAGGQPRTATVYIWPDGRSEWARAMPARPAIQPAISATTAGTSGSGKYARLATMATPPAATATVVLQAVLQDDGTANATEDVDYETLLAGHDVRSHTISAMRREARRQARERARVAKGKVAKNKQRVSLHPQLAIPPSRELAAVTAAPSRVDWATAADA